MILRKLMGAEGVVDPLHGSAELKAARQAFADGDWQPVQSLMRAPGDRSVTVEGLTSDGIPTRRFREFAEADPGSAAHTLLAVRLTKDAWLIRGRDYAERVSKESWQGFHDNLMLALEAAVHGIKLGPPSADARAVMMTIGRGLSMGLPEIESHFEAAHEVVPFHDSATYAMLQARCNKWFGTHEAMFSFARWVSAEAPPGAPAQWAIPMAHLERWLSIADEGVVRAHYFSQPDVRREVSDSARRFLRALPAGTTATPDLLLALNWFAAALASPPKPEKSLLADCVNRIDGRVTEFPWLHLGRDPAAAYRRMVRRSL